MKKLILILSLSFLVLSVSAQDHLVRRPSKPAQTTTQKPASTKPLGKTQRKKQTPAKPRKNVSGNRQSTIPEESNAISYCPDNHHPHLIDLGLPSGTKWACCNVGATKPEAYGGYFAWGETSEKALYDQKTYIYYDTTSNTYKDIGMNISGTQYDVAHMKWGGAWKMPTSDQWQELREHCSSEYTTMNGTQGRLFVSKTNGNIIFLPAAGMRETWKSGSYENIWVNRGGCCYYWLAQRDSDNVGQAYSFRLANLELVKSNNGRDKGLSVRPVAR